MSILTNRPRPVSLIILLYYIILYYIILYYIILYYIILYYTSWHKFWHLNPSVGRGESAGKIFPTMLLHLWFFFNLICNRIMFWTSWILTYWPQGLGGGGGGVCRQNICYHFAALVIYLNLICNMFMFWKSCILTLWSKITLDMFHNYFTSVCMRQFSKKCWQLTELL